MNKIFHFFDKTIQLNIEKISGKTFRFEGENDNDY